MSEKLFELIKQAYTEYRETERLKIANHLEKQGFKVVDGPGAGKGKTEYISGGQLNKPFDLSNWKWVEVKRGGKDFLISLQPPDKDPNGEKNSHVLMDRIGVCSNGQWIITDIDLPMDEKALDELVQIINDWKEDCIE